MRAEPKGSPPPVKPDMAFRRTKGAARPLISQARRYELITPLFGGGVELGVVDSLTPISGKGIRGQLRFWWRACRGGDPRFGGNLDRMKQGEDSLWGAASGARGATPSIVEVVIVGVESDTPETPYEGRTRTMQRWRQQAYAAFPLAPDEDRPARVVHCRVDFTIRITYPRSQQNRAEVEAALWAWETFGGVGARTRRGFGALRLVSVDDQSVSPPAATSVEAVVRAGLQAHVVSGSWPPDVPHLLPSGWNGKVTSTHNGVHAAWGFLIQQYKKFRQEPLGRTPAAPGVNHPGRSKWPEPDAIRRRFPSRTPAHTPSLSMPDKFPRAMLGLPIIFQFKREDVNAGDPPTTTLEGRNDAQKRFASPLILRPLACADGNAVGLALVLKGTAPPPLALTGASGTPPVFNLTTTEAGNISPLGGNSDVLLAFLNTL